MRHILPIVLLCLLTIASTGCKKARLRAQLKELMGSTIVLPEKISCVYDGEVFPMPESLRSKAKLIVYIDSSDCTGCRLSKLIQYSTFAESLQAWNIPFFVLMAPQKGKKEEVTELILSYDYPFPVFLDDNMVYLDTNLQYAGMPSSLYTVLVDDDCRPVLIGDPLSSDAMYKLFFNRIQTINNLSK